MYPPLFIRFNFSDPTLVRMPTMYVKVKDSSPHVLQKYFNQSINLTTPSNTDPKEKHFIYNTVLCLGLCLHIYTEKVKFDLLH